MLNKITHIRCLILRLNSIHSKAIHFNTGHLICHDKQEK